MSILETKDTILTLPDSFKPASSPVQPSGSLKGLQRRVLIRGALVLGDIATASASAAIAYEVARALLPIEFFAPISALAVIAFYAIMGLYTDWGLSPIERLRIRTLGALAYVAVNSILTFATGFPLATAAYVVCSAGLLVIVGHYVEWFIRQSLVQLKIWGVPTVIIGLRPNHALAESLIEQPDLGLRPIGFICDDMSNAAEIELTDLPILGRINDDKRLKRDAEIALVTIDLAEKLRELDHLQFEHVIVVRDTDNGQGIGLHARSSGETIGSEIQRGIYKHHNLWIKRLLDLMISIPLAVVAAPIIAILVLAIRFIDPGAGLFWQNRVGQYGRTIKICKLRTMYLDAEQRLEAHLANCPAAREEWNSHFKLTNDPRVLPYIGNFIRRSSLDELPQIFNVLQGSISLVGPRPFPEYHLKSFDADFQELRASVPPGLTGFWQISARSNGNLSVQKRQDSLYIRNWSAWLDLWILLQTIPAVLMAKGAR
ncbi:sugar transferase [Microvirga solisilvae]|uniref:sugar transferase n=1 Tax=Microvirga solisilvae TaxID=2919498 RepID=UPI001FAFFF6F|nr:sugar transferase [Microvirga solisilvae]